MSFSEDETWSVIQCPLDIATLDKAAALAIATATRVTDLRQYINSDLGYNDLKISASYSNRRTVAVAIASYK